MKANALLRFGIPIFLLVAIIAAVMISRGGHHSKAVAKAPAPSVSKQEAKLLGVEGDTQSDTLATLVGQMKDMRANVQTLTKQNTELRQENSQLHQQESSINNRVDEALQKAQQKFDAAASKAARAAMLPAPSGKAGNDPFSQIKSQIDALAGHGGKADLPAGLGLKNGDGGNFQGGGVFNFKIGGGAGDSSEASASEGAGRTLAAPTPPPKVVWVEPLDAKRETGRGGVPGQIIYPVFKSENGMSGARNLAHVALSPLTNAEQAISDSTDHLTGRATAGDGSDRDKDTVPYFTIAENATLMGSLGMTALIGRVPIGGTVSDPYPFKVIIGRDNLEANGIELPDITGAVMSGTAVGDWTLSCVRGNIESITFIFQDGRIRTVPEPGKNTSKNRSSGTSTIGGTDYLGWLSDPRGVPCIVGERKSNAVPYLSTETIFTGLGAWIAHRFGNDSTSVSSGGTTVTGNSALEDVLNGGLNDVRDWNNKLNGQAFAAIYVKPGAKVAVHLDREIKIDYEPHGRKVNYHHDEHNTIQQLD
jgi:integrating conjugative element protein (TIGR03752 family)